jgi:hypothetical protein
MIIRDRITYRNLGEIFVMRIEDKNIEVGTIENYLAPFNKYVVIKNIYKYPDRVKEYAEACQFTNFGRMIRQAAVLRTFAPISNVIGDVLIPALNESFKRQIIDNRPSPGRTQTMFSYLDPKAIEYLKYEEPHTDLANYLPLQSEFPHIKSLEELKTDVILPFQVEYKAHPEAVAGIIYLDETFGTELLVNKNISYYSSKTTGLWGATPLHKFNDGYCPEENNSHYEHIKTIGGEYNSATFYYGAVAHRPYYPGASDEDLKRGRLIQNIFFDDVTKLRKENKSDQVLVTKEIMQEK